MFEEDLIGAGQELAVVDRVPGGLVRLQDLLNNVGGVGDVLREMVQNIEQRRHLVHTQ